MQNTNMNKAFDSNTWTYYIHVCTSILADYIKKSLNRSDDIIPLPQISPKDMCDLRSTDFPQELNFEEIPELIKKFLTFSNHTLHPKSMWHQTAVPFPLEVIPAMCMSILNSSMSCYETWPISSILEKKMIERLAQHIWYTPNTAGGFFTSGGSLWSLTALLAARQQVEWDIRQNGIKKHGRQLAIMCSSESHYSLRRSAQILGLWKNGIVIVPSNASWKVTSDAIVATYQKALKQGKHVFAYIASACNTWPGIYENISHAADFCASNNIRLHVDGAHGASALLSTTYKYLLKDIHRADSVVRDMHKLMLTPTLLTAVIFKKEANSFKAVDHAAPYLYDNHKTDDHFYDVSKRSLECTKSSMIFKLYFGLMTHWTNIYSEYITSRFDLARKFAAQIAKYESLELGVAPESNIVLFRYLPKTPLKHEKLNSIQINIRKALLKKWKFYIVKTIFQERVYLRCSLMNPFTTLEDINELLLEVIKLWDLYTSTDSFKNSTSKSYQDSEITYEIPKQLVSHIRYISSFL